MNIKPSSLTPSPKFGEGEQKISFFLIYTTITISPWISPIINPKTAPIYSI